MVENKRLPLVTKPAIREEEILKSLFYSCYKDKINNKMKSQAILGKRRLKLAETLPFNGRDSR